MKHEKFDLENKLKLSEKRADVRSDEPFSSLFICLFLFPLFLALLKVPLKFLGKSVVSGSLVRDRLLQACTATVSELKQQNDVLRKQLIQLKEEKGQLQEDNRQLSLKTQVRLVCDVPSAIRGGLVLFIYLT